MRGRNWQRGHVFKSSAFTYSAQTRARHQDDSKIFEVPYVRSSKQFRSQCHRVMESLNRYSTLMWQSVAGNGDTRRSDIDFKAAIWLTWCITWCTASIPEI
ncbi:hypothetical protein E2C01_072871 [Portunus trituberculatus]|uniref:Uncharacterized protein n=1 Tax=Portunus trituberculatus TaxID=210409 RepID=A0A5B7I913_PORTR|nr:hypothetical protein [Portunus trituberculatus]